MREVQDHFFRLAKEQGYFSRAAFKLIEIDDRRHVMRRGDRVLDVGCAPGSWLQVAAERVGEKGVVIGVDLVPVKQRIASNVRALQGDFTTIAPEQLLLAAAEIGGGSPRLFDVILSDMAPSTSGDPQGDHFRSARLCEALLDRAPRLLRPGGNLVMKVFEGAAYGDLLKRTEKLFQGEARGFKPKASRRESPEMYIVAQEWRGEEATGQHERPIDVSVLAPPRRAPRSGWSA